MHYTNIFVGFFFKFIVWYIFESDTLHGSTYINTWWWRCWWWWDNIYPSFFRLTYASIIDWNQIKNCSSNKKKKISGKKNPLKLHGIYKDTLLPVRYNNCTSRLATGSTNHPLCQDSTNHPLCQTSHSQTINVDSQFGRSAPSWYYYACQNHLPW